MQETRRLWVLLGAVILATLFVLGLIWGWSYQQVPAPEKPVRRLPQKQPA